MSIPYRGVASFVGRQYELETLHRKLQKQERVAISAAAGMGGVGKTELAIRYARDNQAYYPGGVCWLTAKESNLATKIVQLAQLHMKLEVPQELGGRLLNLKEQVAWCWQHWRPPEGLVLVVLDDITDWGTCQEVLPTANRFRVLVTTRLQYQDPNFTGGINLDVLSPEEAEALLTVLLGKEGARHCTSHQYRADASLLCEWLGYLPLGLQLVGQYLAENSDLCFAQMLSRLKAQRWQDQGINLDGQQQNSPSHAQIGVRAAFELSWRELTPMTQRIGLLLSLFAPDVFFWKWVESVSQSLSWAESDINQAKNQLHKRHLIQLIEEKEGGYKIHPLIREFLQAKLATSVQGDELKQAFAVVMVAIAQELPDSPTRKDIELVEAAIPHLAELAQNLNTTLRDEDLIWPFVALGKFYSSEDSGLSVLAEPWYKQCLEVVKARLGNNHPHVVVSLNNLAGLYESQGRCSEAEPLFQQALELGKRLLGEHHPHIATSLNNLAGLYYAQGRYSEAEPLFQQALKLWQYLLGDEHPQVATSLNNLAGLYYAQGRYSEAEPLFQQALKLWQYLLGDQHLHVATSLNNLAGLYYAQGRYSEAEPLFQQALKLWKHLLGNEHPDVATSLNNLAGVYYAQGHYSKAEPLYQQALELWKRLLGDEHPDVATSLNNLAGLYNSQGRYSEAEPLFQQALALWKRLLGSEHPHIATSLNNLAGLYNSQGRYSEAEPLFQQALELRKCLLGNDHPDVATSLNNLASLYNSQRRYIEAEPLYQQALELWKRLLGDDHPDVATSLNNLAGLYYAQGRYSEAQALYQQALELSQRTLGVSHPNTIIFRKNLAILQAKIDSSDSWLGKLGKKFLPFVQQRKTKP